MISADIWECPLRIFFPLHVWRAAQELLAGRRLPTPALLLIKILSHEIIIFYFTGPVVSELLSSIGAF